VKHFKKAAALILSLVMMLALAMPASAAIDTEFVQLGEKTATQLVVPGTYEISVSVPGILETETYNEVIVMVDASSSQGSNLQRLKNMLVNLAEEILHDDGSVCLTLMGFGMGPKKVGSFFDAETLAAWIEDIGQADLRQGVSATNCEAALDFVREYIEDSETLDNTFVIFTSDGKTNMDETAFSLTEWEDHPEWWAKNFNPEMIAGAAADGVLYLMQQGIFVSGAAELYPEECVELALLLDEQGAESDAFNAALSELNSKIMASEESYVAFTEAVWADVYANSGMEFSADAEYSTSDIEKAFLDFYNGELLNSYLCTIHRMKNAGFYPDDYNLNTWGARAAAAADALAANDKVQELYMMDFNSLVNTWMNPDAASANHCTGENISYHTANGFGAAIDQIGLLGSEIFTTLYSDVTVYDPMSKWVILDQESIRIYEDDLVIWENGQWLYEDHQPTAETPITVELNENGRYEITWRIKDGALLYTDRYSLRYVVEVDETAEGFRYDTFYPANDYTYATYTDENGDPQLAEIPVPEVKEYEEETFDEGDRGIKIYKSSSLDRTPLSDIVFDIYHVVPAEGETLTQNPSEEEYGKYAVEENLVVTLTTDANGYAAVNLTDLGYGDGYYLIIERPNEKVKAPADPFYVIVPMIDEETHEPLDVVVIYPKNEPVPPVPPPVPPYDEEKKGWFSVLKHSAAGEDIVLPNAQFQLYRLAEEGEEAVLTMDYGARTLNLIPVMLEEEPVILTTDEKGYAKSPELDFGLYFLVETKAPAGYSLLEEPVPVFATLTGFEMAYAVRIPNSEGLFLPETGGIGTTIFTVLGILLCVGAVAILILRKRRAK